MLEQLFINNEIEIALLLAVAAILILLTAYALGTGLSALITDKDIFLGIITGNETRTPTYPTD